jgi:hypothetical protein
MTRDKAFKVLLIINLVLLVADVYTTLRMGALAQYLEANILYKYIGFIGIFLLNILIYTASYYIYSVGGVNTRFYIIWLLVVIATTRLIVIYYNHQVYLDPPTIQEAVLITEKQKLSHNKQIISMNLLPIFHTVITYLFYRYDHVITKTGDSNE